MGKTENLPQDHQHTAGDNAENKHEHIQPSHYVAEKKDIAGQSSAEHSADPRHPSPEDLDRATPPPAIVDVNMHGAGVRDESPETFTGIHRSTAPTTAAGVTAVVSSMRHVWGEMGVLAGTQALMKLNQHGGFDCMSCAWADPDEHRSTAEFCENGAKAVAWEGDTDRVGPEFFAQWSVAELSAKSDYWLGMQGRLTQPMVLHRGATHYEPISWNDAFRMLATELNALQTPHDAIFYTSGRTSNEAAFLYQLFVRQFGTNNLPDCSNMCHESSGSALTPTIGIGKGTVKLDDFEKAQVVVIIGQNPGTNHPRMLTALQQAKRAGAKIIAINPLPEPGLLRFKNPQELFGWIGTGTELADHFLQVRINGDTAVLQGLMKVLLVQEQSHPGSGVDRAFIERETTGFAELEASLQRVSWDAIVEQSGISQQQIIEVGKLLATSDRIIVCWAMGLTQHKNAVATIQDVVNLLLMRGSIGKKGAGVCPVRGHSNVQGDRTMGIWERPREAFLDKLKEVFDFEPPRAHGFDTVEAIKAMNAGNPKVFFAMGGNFLSATPDTAYVASGMRHCRLTAHVSTKLNRAHLVTGEHALILPCLGRSERDQQSAGPQFVSCENSMGVVQSSQGPMTPASEHLLSEPQIVARLAQAVLGARSKIDWAALGANYDKIRDLIEKVIPGFDNYNQRVRQTGGFYLPNLPRDGKFSTETKKANFTVHPLPEHRLERGQLAMMTVRTHDQFNTTIYGLEDRYRGIHNERRVIFMNADDVSELGLRDGQVVDLTSYFNGKTRVARKFIVTPFSIPRRCAATYFPETNVLVPIDSVAEKSNTPTSKYIVIRVTPAKDV